MSFRSIAIGAGAIVLLYSVAYASLYGGLSPEGQFLYTAVARTAMLSLVAIFSALAARQFGWWSEYVGRAWTLFFAGYAMLAVGEIFRRWFPEIGNASELFVVAANLALIGAYFLMARSFDAAGLGFEQSRAKKMLITLAALVVAVALCYEAILSPAQAIMEGGARYGRLVSPLADVITFTLLAPLLLTTFALRGGQVFWIFAFLTTGTIGWMINQGSANLVKLFGGGADRVREGRMIGFAIACTFIAAAALTQWLAARRAVQGVTFRG